jgi:hypothetical protein
MAYLGILHMHRSPSTALERNICEPRLPIADAEVIAKVREFNDEGRDTLTSKSMLLAFGPLLSTRMMRSLSDHRGNVEDLHITTLIREAVASEHPPSPVI